MKIYYWIIKDYWDNEDNPGRDGLRMKNFTRAEEYCNSLGLRDYTYEDHYCFGSKFTKPKKKFFNNKFFMLNGGEIITNVNIEHPLFKLDKVLEI